LQSPHAALRSNLANGRLDCIGETLVENLTIRMDRLLPTDFRKSVDPKKQKKPIYELSVEVELTVKNTATIDFKHAHRLIATHTTTSL